MAFVFMAILLRTSKASCINGQMTMARKGVAYQTDNHQDMETIVIHYRFTALKICYYVWGVSTLTYGRQQPGARPSSWLHIHDIWELRVGIY